MNSTITTSDGQNQTLPPKLTLDSSKNLAKFKVNIVASEYIVKQPTVKIQGVNK